YDGADGVVFSELIGERQSSNGDEIYTLIAGTYSSNTISSYYMVLFDNLRAAHGNLVGEWESVGARVIDVEIDHGSAAVDSLMTKMGAAFVDNTASPFNDPAPPTGGGLGPNPDPGGTSTVGSESFPRWLTTEQYRAYLKSFPNLIVERSN